MIPDDLTIKIREAWGAPSWKRAAHDYHANRHSVLKIEPARLRRLRRLLDSSVTLERAHAELTGKPVGRAASSTVKTLAYQLRGGVVTLRDSSVIRRLSELDQIQLREIAQMLTKRVPPWSPDQIAIFIKLWGISRREK
jgi:hypothetical protein